jgi:hypothetical protein
VAIARQEIFPKRPAPPTKSPVSRALVIPAVIAIAAATARAETTPQLVVWGELPCTHDELVAALALRVGAIAVTVRAERERVWIEVGGRQEVVELDGARGHVAARRIALAAAELAVDELPGGAPAPAPVPEPEPAPEPEPEPVRVAVVDRVDRAAEPVPVTPEARTAWTLTGRVSSSPAQRAGAALSVELGRGRIRFAGEAGVAAGVIDVMRAGDPVVTLRALGVPLRACVVGGGEVSVRACALATPLSIDGGAGDLGVLAGGSLVGTGRTRLGDVELVYQVGLDAHANSIAYRWDGEPVLTTPWVTLWSGVGVRWEGGL